jgi:fatty acid desaturase
MRQAIAAGKAFHVARQDPRLHNTRNVGWTAAVVGGIGLVVGAGAVVPALPYLVVAPWLFGCLYFSLFILVIHECSHNMYLLLQDRSAQKLWNRRVGMAFSAPFFTDYLKHWEEGHTVHHVRPCEEDDPQDRFPLTGRALYLRLAVVLLIPGSVLAFNPSNQYGLDLRRIGLGMLLLVLPAVLLGVLLGWHVGVGMLLGMNVLQCLNFLKKAQEHGNGLKDASDPLLRSRTYFYPLARFASPFHINYHFEHHANYRVPWYALPAYHARLREIVPEHLQPWFFHHRYLEQVGGGFHAVPEELVYGSIPADALAGATHEPAA